MGDRPTLVAEPPPTMTGSGRSVSCDQAIFTSIRSMTGQGYRLIASSAGVDADEKVEITRRSSSHGSLCATDPEPIGLASYRLSTGRHCITYCCHAGCEHTARGGQRVYSHIVLLDPASYRLFNFDPVGVHTALAEVVAQDGPMLKPPARIEPLSLTIPSVSDVLDESSAGNDSDWVPALADQLLTGRRCILVGSHNPLWLLRWALLWLPRDVRESVDLSCGLKFSPARQLQLVMLPKAEPQLRRLIAGQDIEMRDAGAAPATLSTGFTPWFGLLKRWRQTGRLHDLVRLTSNVCSEAIAGAYAHGESPLARSAPAISCF